MATILPHEWHRWRRVFCGDAGAVEYGARSVFDGTQAAPSSTRSKRKMSGT